MSPLSVAQRVTPDITCLQVPFFRFRLLPIGGRSTIIRLASGGAGGLWILVSSPLDATAREEIARLGGDVRYLVTPDLVHMLYIQQFHKAFPEARCLGPEGVKRKMPKVPWFGEWATSRKAHEERFGCEDEIEACSFGSHPSRDVAFLHKPSKTLLQADLLFNLPATEQHGPTAGSGLLGRLSRKLSPGSWLHRWLVWSLGAKDRTAFAESATAVHAWDFERVIPCHGNILESGGKEAWAKTFEKYLAMARRRK